MTAPAPAVLPPQATTAPKSRTRRRRLTPPASITDPLAPDHDHPPVTDPTAPDQGLYGRTFTKEEVQRLVEATTAPLLDEEVRLIQALIQRVVATGYDPTPPHGQRRAAPTVRHRQRAALIENITAACRAVDVLQRTLKTRQALASDSASALFQLLDEAAKCLEADEYGARGAPPTITPL